MKYFTKLDTEGFALAFYNTSVNKDIPETCVEITKEQYNKLLNDINGKAFINGKCTVKQRVFPEPTYKEKRRAEYPPIEDQLDALWKGGAEAATMKDDIMAVKAKYPKL